MEEQIDIIIKAMANALNNVIPIKWTKLYFYGEVSFDKEDYNVGMYFWDKKLKKYMDFSEIPDVYPDFNEFYTYFDEINTLLLKMYDVFLANGQRKWEAMLITLEKKGKMKVEFSYDWFINELNQFERKIIWANKTFGYLPPKDSYADKFLIKYLREKL